MFVNKVKLNNFKSFVGEHEFSFPKTSGLFMVEGDNRVDSDLGSNGSGKTTLFIDSLYYAFFNKTFGGSRASEITSFGKSSGFVEIAFTLHGKDYILKRGRNPNVLELNGSQIEQQDIETLLGLNEQAFCFLLFLRNNNNQFFFDLTNSNKLEVFSNVLNLGFWEQKSEEAKILMNYEKDNINKLKTELSFLHGQIEQINKKIKSLKNSYLMFEEQTRAHVQKIENEILSLADTINCLQNDIKKQLQDRKLAEEYKEQVARRVAKYQNSLEKVSSIAGEKIATRNHLREYITNLEDQVKNVSILGSKCNLCGQYVDPEHHEQHLNNLKKELKEKKDSYYKLGSYLEKVNNTKKKIYSKIKKQERELQEVDSLIKALDREVIKLQSKIEQCHEDIEYRKRLIEIEKNRENTYENDLQKAKLEKEKCELLLEQKQNEIDEKNKLVSSYAFWQKAFKEIRYYIISEYTKAFETEMNKFLSQLGLAKWNVKVDIEREKVSGGVASGFFIKIRNNKNKTVSIGSVSAGERQRIKIACGLAMSNVICRSVLKMTSSNQIFIDEPTEHLSKEGIGDLVECLKDIALMNKKQIWMIDHHMIDWGGFNARILIIKDDSGSKIANRVV